MPTRMMDLVADTRRMTYGSMADQLNFLAVEAPLGAAELVMTMDLAAILPGMVLSSGLNVYYVTGTIAAEKKVLVYPTYDNSHSDALPSGSPVQIRGRVTDWQIFNHLNDMIRAMSSSTHGLYREGSWETNEVGVWNTFPVPVDAQDMTRLHRVSVLQQGTTDAWYEIPMNSVKWQPENDTIRLTTHWMAGQTVKFDYKAPYRQATKLTEDVVVELGLSETMIDIPPLGAAAAIMRSAEGRRAQPHAQGDSRRAEEIASGQNATIAREMDRKFKDRIDDEYIRLVNRNPIQRVL